MSRRRILSVAAAAFFVLPLPVLAQTFEGVIKQHTLDLQDEPLYNLLYAGADDEPEFDNQADWLRYVAGRLFEVPLDELPEGDASALTLRIRGSLVRYDQEWGPGYVVIDLSTGTTRIVDPSSRSYIEYTAEDAKAAAEAADAATREAEGMMSTMGLDPADAGGADGEEEGVHFTPKTRARGLTETVNGFSASAYEAEAGNEIGRGWCTQDQQGIREALEHLGDQTAALGGDDDDPSGSDGPVLEDLICEKGLPVRTQILTLGTGGGLAYSVTEILSVERTPLPDDVFEVPAGFTKKSMREMWGRGGRDDGGAGR